ncbi:MAG: metallopeptidase family protein [Elusimicrobiota bacterium]
MKLSQERFDLLAEEAFDELPREVRDLLYNIEIEVRPRPGEEAGEWAGDEELMGLHVGPTRAEMIGPFAEAEEPAQIFIYQRNLEDSCEDMAELKKELRLTLKHEIAHHFGMTDEELEEKWPEGA